MLYIICNIYKHTLTKPNWCQIHFFSSQTNGCYIVNVYILVYVLKTKTIFLYILPIISYLAFGAKFYKNIMISSSFIRQVAAALW